MDTGQPQRVHRAAKRQTDRLRASRGWNYLRHSAFLGTRDIRMAKSLDSPDEIPSYDSFGLRFVALNARPNSFGF